MPDLERIPTKDQGLERTVEVAGYAAESRYTPDGQEYEASQMFSQESNKLIDEQIKKILTEAYLKTESLIKKHKNKLDELSQALLDREVLELEEYEEIVRDIEVPRA